MFYTKKCQNEKLSFTKWKMTKVNFQSICTNADLCTNGFQIKGIYEIYMDVPVY